MAETYEKKDSLLVKLNEYLVTAIDGSDIVIPSTEENELMFGKNNNMTNNPVMGKISVIYDCINKIVLDGLIGQRHDSERAFASRHLNALKENIKQKTITIFDRGYCSVRLLDQMVDNNQKFLFRLKRNHLERYQKNLKIGENKMIEVSFDRKTTNDYRNDKSFRMKMLNTKYALRICRIPLISFIGETTDEVLLTNLSFDKFNTVGLKELYNLRWNIETSYNVIKNKMKLEEFSGYRSRLILQDIYTTIWLYNITMFQIIYTNKEHEIPEERYKYQMKRNTNVAIGVMKSYLAKFIICADSKERDNLSGIVEKLIMKNLVPVRPGRSCVRKKIGNKSRMSYRYSY